MEICSPRVDNLGGIVGCRPIWAVYKQLHEISTLTAFKMCLKEWHYVFVYLLFFALMLYRPEYISLSSHQLFLSCSYEMCKVLSWRGGTYVLGKIYKTVEHVQTLHLIIDCTKFTKLSTIYMIQLTGCCSTNKKLAVNRFIGTQCPIQMQHRKLIVYDIKHKNTCYVELKSNILF